MEEMVVLVIYLMVDLVEVHQMELVVVIQEELLD